MSIGNFDPNQTGGNVVRKSYIDIERDVSNIVRILPPFGTYANSNKIAQYWAIHFGFKDSRGKMKPIPCILRKDKDGMIVTQCPLCDKVAALKNLFQSMAQNNDNPVTLKTMEDSLKSYNVDKKYNINVMTLDNKIGVLKLGYKAYKQLDNLIKKLHNSEGVNSVNVGDGIFFDIQKTGFGFDTIYTVEPSRVTYKNTEGRLVSEYRVGRVDESVIKRMEREAFDLAKMYKTFTPEEMTMIATGDPAVLDRLFAKPEAVEEGADEEGHDEPVVAGLSKSTPEVVGLELATAVAAQTLAKPVTQERNAMAAPKSHDPLMNVHNAKSTLSAADEDLLKKFLAPQK